MDSQCWEYNRHDKTPTTLHESSGISIEIRYFDRSLSVVGEIAPVVFLLVLCSGQVSIVLHTAREISCCGRFLYLGPPLVFDVKQFVECS